MNLKIKYNKALEQKNQLQVEADKLLLYENFQDFESFFSEVYQQLFQNLFSYGMQICGNKELVKDCIQELFSEFWKNQKTLTKIKSVKPYLLKCIKRKIKRALGKGKRLYVDGRFEFEMSQETKLINDQQQAREQHLLKKRIQNNDKSIFRVWG